MSTASDAPRPGPQRLSDQVAAHLVGRILRGELQPGFRLNEVELSKDLGVSRAPLREAIANLGQQGLVVITPYRGAVVPQLTEEELQETREIRAVLERLAVEVAFKRSPTLDTTELRAQLDAMRAAAHGGDTVAAALAHVELHRAIARLSEWPQLIAFLDLLIARSLALQGYADLPPEELTVLAGAHDSLLDVFESGDADAAGAAIHAHVIEPSAPLVNYLRRIKDSAGG